MNFLSCKAMRVVGVSSFRASVVLKFNHGTKEFSKDANRPASCIIENEQNRIHKIRHNSNSPYLNSFFFPHGAF